MPPAFGETRIDALQRHARWEGYGEAELLYILALGSPTHPLPAESYAAWASTYQWKQIYGYEFVYGGSLFIHQYSHIWVDFREIQDAFARDKGIDYCENSRRATYVQREYAIRNPLEFAVRPGNWVADGPPFSGRVSADLRRVLFSVQFQSDLFERSRCRRGLDVALPFRN